MKLKIDENNFFLFTQKSSYLNEDSAKILRNLNYLPFAAGILNSLFLILTQDYLKLTNTQFLCLFFTPFTCIITNILLYFKKYYWATINSYIILPIVDTIVVMPQHSPVLFTFPLLIVIASFFIFENNLLLNFSFFVCSICIMACGLDSIYITKESFKSNLALFILDFLMFDFIFYIMLVYLRNTIYKNENKLKLKNQQLIDSTVQNNKITTIISHDVKVPINFIKNLLLSYRKGKITSDELIKQIPILEKEINYISHLFEELSWTSKDLDYIGNLPDISNLHTVVDEVCKAYFNIALEKKVQLINQTIKHENYLIKTGYCKIVLRNLISNAIKFSKLNGHIIITAVKEDNVFKINVNDNGIGIDSKKFEILKNGGSLTTIGTNSEIGEGYGLAFCNELIHKNGGNLFIESTYGKGSTFSFTLPIIEKN